MIAAGIPEQDWQYVDEVITRESRWRETVTNSKSGSYGLCQSLPANKMASEGADWKTNPVTQLRWCHKYAMTYGNWPLAASFSRCEGKCYSGKVNRWVYKDHKWF